MTVRQMEKVAKANIERYNDSTMLDLSFAYDRFSSAKANAWRYCKEQCDKFGGWGLKVISKNTFMFTAGFLFVDDTDGSIKFMYITPNYDVPVDWVW